MGVLVVVAVVVAIVVWPSGGSKKNPSASAAPGQRGSSAPIVIPSFTMPSLPFSIPSAAPAGPPLRTADGLKTVLSSMREQLGSTMGFSLTVFTDYAVSERPDPKNSHIDTNWQYRGGKWTHWATDTTTASFDQVADLSAFNTDAMATTLANAAPQLGAPDNDNTYLNIEGVEGGGLKITIHTTDPGTGFLEVNTDGSVAKVWPP
jgi:hypothetical protein